MISGNPVCMEETRRCDQVEDCDHNQDEINCITCVKPAEYDCGACCVPGKNTRKTFNVLREFFHLVFTKMAINILTKGTK